MSKTCTPFLVVFQLRDSRRCGSYVFYCVASAAHFLFFGGAVMTDIEVIRELHCYRKMYSLMQKTVNGCIEECRDLVVREKLVKVMQDAEDIYTGEEYEYKDLNADERIIVALLSYIADTEILYATDADMQLVDDCVDWSLAIQNKKVELSEEFVEEQVKKIFAMANKKYGSVQ